MKKITILTIVLLLTGGVAFADPPSATLQWDPPTHRIANDDCSQQGPALSSAEIDLLEYTVSYRAVGTTTWVNIETDVTTIVIPGLGYNTTYEASVGSHFPGKSVFCATGLVQWTTPEAPPPGSCRNLTVVSQ
jgi:hypothetical protein